MERHESAEEATDPIVEAGGDVYLVRALVRASFEAGAELGEVEARMAAALGEAVAGLGGRTEVLRVAHVFHPGWSGPLDPVPNRAVAGLAAPSPSP